MSLQNNELNHLYTCITCRVGFKDADFQRLHYKTDWHRYNLKRKVADIPPVTFEEFQIRLTNQKNVDNQLQQDNSVYCKPCRKLFGNPNAFDNHLNSKKHKDNLKNYSDTDDIKAQGTKQEKKEIVNGLPMEEDEEIEEVDSDEWEEGDNPIDSNDCLFCSHHSRNFFKNLEHMTTAHSFFIPDIEYCTDVQGLLRYLGEKVSSGFMCLWCNESGRTFHSVEAAKAHMLDKGHCRMLHEGLTLAEYADFYDYSSSYPDGEVVDADEEVDVNNLDDSEYQLVLPSGVKVGHRSLMRYYKQNLSQNTALIPSRNNKKLHKVLATYRALGWTQTQQEQAARKARDIHYLKRMQSKWYTKLGIKANKFQKHFRQQVNY